MSIWKTKSAPESFCTIVRKAMSVLAKCLMGEKLRSGRSQDSEFQVIRKTTDPSNNKNGSGIPKSHIHVINGRKSRLEIWLACSDKFGDIAILFLSKKSIYHSQKNGLCTRRWYHLFLVRVNTIRGQKHNGISSLTKRVYIHVCIDDIGWRLKNCTEKSLCAFFLS